MGDTIMVPAALVAYLRKGLLLEQWAAAERLSILTSKGIVNDELAYRSALWPIGAAQAVLEHIDVVEPASPEDVELDRSNYPFLVLKALESQYQAETSRLQDAATDGFTAPTEKVHALGELVAIIGEQIGRSAKVKQEATYLRFMRR